MPDAFGIYVHIPWCARRCPYCAFNVRVDPAAPYPDYFRALRRQWAALATGWPGRADSVYFGGGTPSMAPPALIGELIAELDPQPGAEISLEANPGTLDGPLLDGLLRAGVSRLSVGVQTFDPRLARLLNRGHTVAQSSALLARVAAAGFRSWSLDLIFAVPGQRLDDLRRDLDAALALDPPHLSIYGLSAEEGTPYTSALAAGRLSPPPEETWEAMYLLLEQRLPAAGLERYEISNFARPGHRCRHNEHYYRGRHYAGLGAGAHGWSPDGTRSVGLADPAAFIADPTAWAHLEQPRGIDRAVELLLSTLRHVDGVPRRRLRALGFQIGRDTLLRLRSGGLIATSPGSIRLVGRGWRLADGVLRSLCGALEALAIT